MSSQTAALVEPSEHLLRFAQRQVERFGMKESRKQQRYLLAVPAVVQRVNTKLQPVGEPFAAVTRDVSLQGMGLIFEAELEHELFAVRFAAGGEDSFLLLSAIWDRAMGPFHYVGFRVLQALDSFPTACDE